MSNLYRGFKKVSEDDKQAILEHENGHRLNIAKSGLDKKLKRQLESLPLHQAKGTQPIVQEPAQALNEEMLMAKERGVVAPPVISGQYSEGPAVQPEAEAPTSKKVGKVIGQVLHPVMEGVANAAKQVVGEAVETLKTPYKVGQAAADIVGPGVAGVIEGYTGKKAEYVPTAEREQLAQQQAQPQAQQPALQPPPEPDFLAPERQVSEAPTLAPQEQPAPAAPAAPAQPQAAAAPQQPLVPRIATPLLAAKDRKPEEILQDPNSTEVQRMQAEQSLYNRNVTELRNMRMKEQEVLSKLEPKKIFNDASLGNKLLMFISVIAGGIGEGLTGKQNQALKALDDAFQRDWEAQKEARDNKLNLHKVNMDLLKDEMSARLQTIANYKNLMLAKMEEAKERYNRPLEKRRLELAQLQLTNDIEKLNDDIAQRQTNKQIKALMPRGAAPATVRAMDPSTVLENYTKDEKTKDKVTEEIDKRKAINQGAPLVLAAAKKVFDDYQSLSGQTVGRFKPPESVKDLKNEIRGLIPEVSGEQREAREAKVEALFQLLVPGPGDIFDRTDYEKRLSRWLQQNVRTPYADRIGLNLNAFDATAIKPERWQDQHQDGQLIVNKKTGQILVRQQGQWVPYGK